MTDKEIIEALECCIIDRCSICPCRGEAHCVATMSEYAHDLIKKQQAEIDKLKSDVFGMEFETAMYKASSENSKAKAIKEFAEKLKTKVDVWEDEEFYFQYVTTKDIDNLVKEMVGAENE